MARRHWILVASPDVWDVWDWAESGEPFEGWTISRNYDEISKGDDVALWISGNEAGIYGIGRTTSGTKPYHPPPASEDSRWKKRPDPARTRYVDADMSEYFFDRPIRKGELLADPGFAGSLVLRMPRGGNPFPVTSSEWAALKRHTRREGRGIRSEKPTRSTDPVITERALGTVQENIVPAVRVAAKVREQKESRLVTAYQRHLGRPLTIHSIRLLSGERLVTDGYDAKTNTLIEAKASSDRASVRMALGQLLDYSRFLTRAPKLVILLPSRPTDDLVQLAKANGVIVVSKHGNGFVTA